MASTSRACSDARIAATTRANTFVIACMQLHVSDVCVLSGHVDYAASMRFCRGFRSVAGHSSAAIPVTLSIARTSRSEPGSFNPRSTSDSQAFEQPTFSATSFSFSERSARHSLNRSLGELITAIT